MDLYRNAGAKYFVALANHHDNFDNYDSTYHAWNSGQDWAEEGYRRHLGQGRTRAGLRFGVPTTPPMPGTGSRPPMAMIREGRGGRALRRGDAHP